MLNKKCSHCKIVKSVSSFIKTKTVRWKGDEYSSWCKLCNNERHRQSYLLHREERLLRLKNKWSRMSKESKDKHLLSTRNFHRRKKLEVIAHYGGKCACCGETNWEFLEIDHINNNGAKHRKEIGYRNMTLWVMRNSYPKNLQILCSNCNMSKGRFGYCPHNKI